VDALHVAADDNPARNVSHFHEPPNLIPAGALRNHRARRWFLNFLILRNRLGMENDPRSHTRQTCSCDLVWFRGSRRGGGESAKALPSSQQREVALRRADRIRRPGKPAALRPQRHLKTRPPPPRVRLKVPMVSFCPAKVTVSVIFFPSVQPVYRAGWPVDCSLSRIGPGCSGECVPFRLKRPRLSVTSGPSI